MALQAGQQVQAPPLGRTRAGLNKADDRPVCFSGNRRYRRALALSAAKLRLRKKDLAVVAHFDGRLTRHRDGTRTLLQQGKLSVTAATSSRFALT